MRIRALIIAGVISIHAAWSGAASGQPVPCVAVTEIMFDPAAVPDTDGEWFEITNYSLTATYNLQGWTFCDSSGAQSFAIDRPLWIGPRSFLLLARTDDPEQNGGVVTDFAYGASLPLANDGDTILILSPSGDVIDLVGYAGGAAPAGAALACNVGHQVLNDPPWRWYAATTVYGAGDRGTPGQANEEYTPGYCSVDIGVHEPDEFPTAAPCLLRHPAPNPGAPPFSLSYHLDAAVEVRLVIYDLSGRLLRTLEDGPRTRGDHACIWDGRDRSGHAVAAGVYWIRLEAGDHDTSLPVALHR